MKHLTSSTRTDAARAALWILTLTLSAAGPLDAQSLLDRPPNMGGAWVGRPGDLHFQFLHRFMQTGAPLRKVFNYPTFLLGATVPGDVLLGARYATNSELVTGIPNEWEFFARIAPVREARGAPVTVSVLGAYNQAAQSLDGEVEIARGVGPVRLLVAGRGFSNALDAGESRFAVAAGATLRLHTFIALAGDYGRFLDLDAAGAKAAWSAGIQLAIPYTPHTLSIHASNASTTTVEGATVGVNRTRWGFEFTVPVTLSRYFGSGGSVAPPPAASAAGVAAEVGMTNQLRFTPDTIRIRVGERVRWTNTSDVIHTVTADPGRAAASASVRLPVGARPFDSGDMPPGASFEYTFTVAGEYTYFCVPHEMAGMTGTIIVEGEGA